MEKEARSYGDSMSPDVACTLESIYFTLYSAYNVVMHVLQTLTTFYQTPTNTVVIGLFPNPKELIFLTVLKLR